MWTDLGLELCETGDGRKLCAFHVVFSEDSAYGRRRLSTGNLGKEVSYQGFQLLGASIESRSLDSRGARIFERCAPELTHDARSIKIGPMLDDFVLSNSVLTPLLCFPG